MTILTVLGGASAYTPGLMQALIAQAAQLPLRAVRLYDTDGGRLDVVARLCANLARSAGAPFTVTPAATLEQALEGAGLVLNSTRPGGLAARRIDETLPLEFDIPGQETVGPGGFFYALRSVPEALRVGAAMARLAPGAILLNYTNPSNIVTQALADQALVPVIGMCDQSDEDLEALGHALGAAGTPGFACNGLNHATWYQDVGFGAEPCGALGPGLAAPPGLDEEHQLRFTYALEMARAEGRGWPNSYLPYYLYPQAFVEQARRVGPRSDVVAASLGRYYAHFAEEAEAARPQLRFYRGSAGFGDMAVKVMRALFAAEPLELVLNLPNRGATAQFADDTVIETRVRLSKDGIARTPVPAMPASLAPLMGALERYQRLSAGAAASAALAPRIAALAANPLVGDAALAARMLARARTSYGDLIGWEA
ncbi:hypothetical protein RBA41_26975 [Massilia sp. CCM 9210]|uniref:family 4 glycosyl hydrolase n=1 Tax=Massilia scottii TaxID=3057166 RepID=UPI0027967575|nr:hypothetical protein [Massilia sp. CCM 9210]MDQ1816954.1 hypothetical protein [Massilia sp. CCM 9210]